MLGGLFVFFLLVSFRLPAFLFSRAYSLSLSVSPSSFVVVYITKCNFLRTLNATGDISIAIHSNPKEDRAS